MTGNTMHRRSFLTLLGGAAAAWPIAARAQQQKVPVIGYLSGLSLDTYPSSMAAVLQGLKESGYVDGVNVVIEYYWADGHNDRLPALAAEMVRRRVDVIIALGGTASALAAQRATTTIPVIFANGADPVKFGLVASLARPGGNITGVSYLLNALDAKRLGLLHELVPTAATFGFLVDPTNPNAEPDMADMQATAALLRHKLVIVSASNAAEVDTAFTNLVQQRVDALAIGAHVFFIGQSQHLAELAIRHGMPVINPLREFAAAGGLMSYGGNPTEAHRQAGLYAGRVLKGEKPADLPVQQVTRFEMVLNLKTAKAIGLTVPNTILVSADEVIE